MPTSQPDALAELRARPPVAPPHVRARVLEVARQADVPAAPRRHLLRPALVLAAAVALVAALVGVAVLGGRNGAAQRRETLTTVERGVAATANGVAPAHAASKGVTAPAPSGTRLQDYRAWLRLRVHDGRALSAAVQRTLALTRSLGGYVADVSVANGDGGGDASIRVRIPVGRVQEAVARLSRLGTIVGEQVRIRDVQAGVDAVDRRIARLQRRLRDLRAQQQTDEVRRQLDALTRQVERLQRARAATVRQARLAVVTTELTTRSEVVPPAPHHGALDGAWTALRRIGVALLYGVIVGGPFVLAGLVVWLAWRLARRRAEARLLA